MQTFEITQKVLSFGPTYQVRAQTSEDVLMTIKGKLLSASPKLTMVEGGEGAEMASMTGNFVKTKFTMHDTQQREIGLLSFPLMSLKKSFSLKVGDHEYKAEGGFFGGTFKCTDPAGQTVLEISKQASLRDKFAVTVNDPIPAEVALMAAVAIDQRFFEDA